MPRARRLAVLGLPLLAACGPRPEAAPPLGWSRFDLAAETPIVEAAPSAAAAPFRQGIGYLGREEVRDAARAPTGRRGTLPVRRAPQIEVLEQAAGVRLAWPVELGESPYASFIPVGWRERPCRCRYRFGVRDGEGEIHELHRVEAGEAARLAPGAVEVDLAPFAGRRVELLTDVDRIASPAAAASSGEPPPALVWGSPAVYHRRPVAGRDGSGRKRPNVLLLGIDTLRADHVGAFRREPSSAPSLTPAIDRLAEESDVWLEAYATFNITNPSFASISTGLYGKDHGVYDLQTPLPPSHLTLAEVFSQAGYETLAVISASHLGDLASGLGQGFGEVVVSDQTFAAELPVDRAMEWIDRRRTRSGADGTPPPFFAWLHLFDPHTPHTPPEPYGLGFRPERPAGLGPVTAWLPFRRPGDRPFEHKVLGGHRDLYAGEVAYLDRQVDRLLGFLESRRLLDETVVALVADHGENLGEHGIDYRHAGLWETTLHVPLLVRWPGASAGSDGGRRLRGLVQTLDLFPTLLAAAGLDPPPQDGLDLRSLARGARPGRRAVFAELVGRKGAMVRTATHKYLRTNGDPFVRDGVYLFDLTADPAEDRNLAGRGLEVERELAALLDRWLAERRRGPAPPRRALSREEEARLRALGYLE